ncbi:MAG: peptidase C11 [Lachnospiraceae bacterium]|nr:peptidase C11 [Lachnospiraceae bacterium]
MDENRRSGRQKNVTGSTDGAHRRGEGLNSGQVGSQNGYSGRRRGSTVSFSNDSNTSGGGHGVTRAGGISLLTIIGIVIYMIIGGKFGGTTTDTDQTPQNGDYVSVNESNVNTEVAKGSRAKYTTIKGNGNDTVTILVYMCGTDLESKHGMASNDLQEMASANLGSNVNIIVFTGGCSKWKTSGISNSVNQIYQVQSGKLAQLKADAGNGAMVTPSTLSGFIKYGVQNFPANRYELILWDHGGGSVSGYGYDEKNQKSGSMTLAGINQALKDGGVKFDFIGFDACLMATAETALMLDPYADYLIASEETEPGIGWYYTNWLNELGKNPSMATVDIGKKIVDDFVSECKRRCNGQKTTLSVIDLAEFSNTIPGTLKNFAKSISNELSNDNYKKISDARAKTREFASSNRIDQVDLYDLAERIGTDEAKQLTAAIKSAVKYNRTSTNMSNCHGVSIYFPYRSTGKVDSACRTYDQIGLDSEYGKCIRQFASQETGGQVAAGGSTTATSLIGTLLGGGGTGGSSGSTDIITGLLSGFLGGGRSITGLDESNSDFMNDLDVNKASQYYANNYLDASKLVWTYGNGAYTMNIGKDQWAIIHSVDKNMFLDDGTGYIDLGLDELFEYDNGVLTADMEKTWVGINGQLVAYYHTDTLKDAESGAYLYYGYIPALLNDERVKLQVVFGADGVGTVIGATAAYVDQETDTVAKNVCTLSDATQDEQEMVLKQGDKIDFICDYYSYDGEYQNSYRMGYQVTYYDTLKVTDLVITDQTAVMSYKFTDMYNKEYWTDPVIR